MYLVTKEFLDLINRVYPGINIKQSYRDLMFILLFVLKCRNDKYEIVLSRKKIAIIEFGPEQGKIKNEGHHYSCLPFLKAFQKDVMCVDTFTWTKHNYSKKQARTAVVVFTPEVEQALIEQSKLLEKGYNKEELYNFKTQTKYNKKMAITDRKQEEAQVNMITDQFATLEQKPLLEYLNGLSVNSFSKLTDTVNLSLAYIEAASIQDETKRLYQSKLLHKIYFSPKPLYQPSKRGNTVRIFPYNESMLMLKRNIRKVLCKGWVEFDLASSQLAIISKIWNVPYIHDYLISGKSIWKDLCNHLQITYSDENKKILKTALYSICFGKSKKKLLLEIEYSFGSSAKLLWMNHHIIQALFKARSRRVSFIMSRGYIITAQGKQVFVSGKDKYEKLTKVRSMLAEEAQSIEFWLLEPVIDLAKTTKNFIITLWQSDGFSVKFTDKSKQDRWTKRIQDVVLARANQLNVPTHLELEIL